MADTRLLIIDASTNKRIATELKARGRKAVSTTELGLRCATDPELLEHLIELDYAWILVTADDHMPNEHAEAVLHGNVTLAVIDPTVSHPRLSGEPGRSARQ